MLVHSGEMDQFNSMILHYISNKILSIVKKCVNECVCVKYILNDVYIYL